MNTPEMSMHNPEEIQNREKYKEMYESIVNKIYRDDIGEKDREEYDIAQFDVYSHDTDRAVACFEVFQASHNLFVIDQIIRQTKNEEFKAELAKLMDPTGNIGSFESHPDEGLNGDSQRKSREFQVSSHRNAIESMIEHSSGETKTLFEKKLQEFEDFVQTF